MATKWIKVPVTLHVPGKKFVPFKWDANGGVLEGNYHVEEFPPLTPVELDAEEADRLLKRFADDGRAGEASAEEIAAAKKAKGQEPAAPPPRAAPPPESPPS